MNWILTVFVIILFVILSPGVILTLPSKSSKPMIAALVHGILFSIIFQLTSKMFA
jgi:hypothetical protein